MKYFLIIFFCIAGLVNCIRNGNQPILIKEDNKYFKTEFFTMLDTVPDEMHIKQIGYYGIPYLKKGYKKQFFRVWFLGIGGGDHFIEVYIDSSNHLHGTLINAPENKSFEKKSITDAVVLCKLNNVFIENKFHEFHVENYYYNAENRKAVSRDYVFHFEYASPMRYKNVYFVNPYVRYEMGMEAAMYPMKILDAIYEYINDKEIRRVIDNARNEVSLIKK